MSDPMILILPGDGIGPEVMAEVRKVIAWLKAKRGIGFNVEEDLPGRRLRLRRARRAADRRHDGEGAGGGRGAARSGGRAQGTMRSTLL